MIRLGKIGTRVGALTATVRGLRQSNLGHLRAVADLPVRREGVQNSLVLGVLMRRFPRLHQHLDPEVLEYVRAHPRARFFSLEELTLLAGTGVARALARRLWSGQFVANTPQTRLRKLRRGLSATPGIATGQLANALQSATVRWE